MHKIVIAVIVLCACLLSGASASAQECPWGTANPGGGITYCVSECGNYTYTQSEGAITINYYQGPRGDVVIPATIDAMPVVGIGYMVGFRYITVGAFEEGSMHSPPGNVTSVVIPDSVTRIDFSAFRGCSSLTSVVIPDSVTFIGERAFESCRKLPSVTIPESVTSLGGGAFSHCSGLTAIEVEPDNPNYSSQGGVLYDKARTVLVQYPAGRAGDFTFPPSVTSIGSYAFAGSTSLSEIVISESVTSIGSSAFYDCTGLTSVVIGDGVTSIGPSAFLHCKALANITIPASVTSIGYRAFYYCSALLDAFFLGNAPVMGTYVFFESAPGFMICYTPEATGFSTPTWYGYPAEPCADGPPSIGDGPYVAAGAWSVLSASAESPTVFNQNRSVLWTFSDDHASCSEDCTHAAEYQVVGDADWTAVAVSSDADHGYAWVDLSIKSLQNATTYAFRFAVTDCASQTTQSGEYYFRVADSDAPPVITGGPWVAAGPWPRLPTSEARAFVLDQDYDVLWTFSDDYASCSGLCTHRARYRKVGDTNWTWIPVSTDPDSDWYAYTTLPVENLAEGPISSNLTCATAPASARSRRTFTISRLNSLKSGAL